MKSRENKIWASVALVLTTVALLVITIVILGNNDKVVPSYLGLIFAIIPAYGFHAIWRKKTSEE